MYKHAFIFLVLCLNTAARAQTKIHLSAKRPFTFQVLNKLETYALTKVSNASTQITGNVFVLLTSKDTLRCHSLVLNDKNMRASGDVHFSTADGINITTDTLIIEADQYNGGLQMK